MSHPVRSLFTIVRVKIQKENIDLCQNSSCKAALIFSGKQNKGDKINRKPPVKTYYSVSGLAGR